MSRIAIASYFAPPHPAVASHRVLRMTGVLQAAGHEVQWVTLDPDKLPKQDPTLQALMPEGLKVHGSGETNLVDRHARNLFEKVVRTVVFALPHKLPVFDRHVEWSLRLRRELPKVCRREQLDAVLICCGPHGQLTAVPHVRRACPDIQILVDYRDLLSGNTWRQAPSERLRKGVRRRERKLLAKADALFLNTSDARDRFVETFGEIDGLDVQVARNAADYDAAHRVFGMELPVTLGPGFHIGFFGTIFPKRRLLPVLQSVAKLPPELRAQVHLHVYCDAENSAGLLAEDLAAIGESSDSLNVHRHDFLGWGDALRTMRAMDVLALVNSADQEDQIFVPGKVFDYLMAQRPVWFFGEPGDAWRIVAETSGKDWCFSYRQVDDAVARMREVVAGGRPADVAPVEAFSPKAAFAPILARLG